MNSVASPLRPEMAAASAARRHPRAAGRDDVLAKAHAIALAQAQIQAQVQGYAAPAPRAAAPRTAAPRTAAPRTAAPARTASTHRPRFRSASGSNVPAQPRPQPQPQPQPRTLRQLHGDPRDRQPRTAPTSNCRATAARPGPTANPSTRTATNPSANPAVANANLSARSSVTRTRVADEKPRTSTMTKQPEPVEWRVAVDPKSKRPYYYHPVTRETTWKKPAELVARERRDKARFFAHMERNIRAKLRDGRWLRDSTGSLEDERQSSSSTTSTASSSRSSLGTSSLGTSSSAPPAALFLATRSLPTTPDFGRAADVGLVDGDNQRESDGEDEAATRPTLFRTLSSYETPVAAGAKRAAVPSPIHERVRLAKLAPRASDLESYARTTTTTTTTKSNKSAKSAAASNMMTNTTSTMTPTTSPTRTPKPRRRSNSTGTIFVRMGTMNAPDQDCTIQCVATVLRAHMMEALDAPVALDPRFDLFVGQRERRLAAIADDDNQAEAALHGEQDAAAAIPALSEIAAFVTHVFSRAQMESECIIMSLIYVERLLKATSGALQLRGKNWRRVLFCSMVMASKVWDDLSMCNADFSKIWPELSLKQINELELTYLSAVEYNVRVSAVSYAKYYFHLRSMCATMGMAQSFDESAPLNLDGARKMQVLSEEYQERSKLLPAPRRRSVTITTTSSAERLRSASGKPKAAAKPSPAASLEQLVQMQVRPAGGGNSLSSSMYRLSTLSKQG